MLGFTVTLLSLAGRREVVAQYASAYPSSTSVVASQPVVVPTDPALISGWYPGKLLDTWAANRRTYRAATLAAPVTTAMPVASYRPVTTYRPVTGVAFQSTYLPIRTYRPIFGAPVVATTAYSPIVTTSAVCCDPCSATVTSYPATSDCCGTTVSGGSGYGEPTPIPTLSAEQSPTGAGYRGSPSNQESGSGDGEKREEDTVMENGGTGGQGNDELETSFEPPLLRDPRWEAPQADKDNKVAYGRTTAVREAVYREPVRPRLATTSRPTTESPGSGRNGIPSRAEREATWTPVFD